MLYQIQHDNKSKLWCGPAAIAAVTGYPTSIITRMIRDVSGGPRVTGTSNRELLIVMRRLGYVMVDQLLGHRGQTLANFCRLNRAHFARRPMIVNLTNHYVVLAGRRFVDNMRPDPVPISSAPLRRALVERAWTFERRLEAQLPPPVARVRDNSIAKAKRLAAKHGIEIERDGSMWRVTCPALEHDDPHEGCNGCYEPGEVLSAVEDYVSCLTNGYLEAVTEPEHVAVALPPCPDKPVDAVAYALEHHGPDTPIGIACTLSLLHGLDIRGRQVRGAAISLVGSGRARWRGDKLALQAAA